MKKKTIYILASILFALALTTVGPLIVEAATSATSASVTNSGPVASSAELNGATDITLTTNTTTSVVGTVTITDNNGCEDIDSVSGVLYRTNITGGAGASDNNRTHYSATCTSNNDCTGGGSDLTETYNLY